MIKEVIELHPITDDDLNRIFSSYQTYVGYSCSKTNTKAVAPEFYLNDDYAIAC